MTGCEKTLGQMGLGEIEIRGQILALSPLGHDWFCHCHVRMTVRNNIRSTDGYSDTWWSLNK